jgi:hypothetical protein
MESASAILTARKNMCVPSAGGYDFMHKHKKESPFPSKPELAVARRNPGIRPESGMMKLILGRLAK